MVRRRWASRTLLLLAAWAACLTRAGAQEVPQSTDRIVTPEEVQEAERSPARVPIRIISYPHRAITGGMEKGLIKVEDNHLRERLRLWSERLREIGVTPLLGGM